MRVTASHALPRQAGLGLLACLVAGLPIGFDIDLIGRITGSEIVLLLLLPVAVLSGRVPPFTWPLRSLIVLSLVWLAAQFASDLVNETPAENMVRGAARAGITALLIAGFFAVLADRPRNLRALFVAIGMGLNVGHYFNPNPFAEGEPWKFGYGFGTTMLIVAASCGLWASRQRSAAMALCVGAAALNLALGFRSLAGIAFMTGLLMASSLFLGTYLRTLSALQVGATLLALLVGGVGVIEVYAFAARDGLLGMRAQERFLGQVDERGVLLSGRSELPIAIEAVNEKPLLGHGSWAVNEYYATLYWEMSGLMEGQMPTEEPDFIPTHSHLMGAWVEGGTLAALFWFYVIAMLGRAIIAVVRSGERADPIVAFVLMHLAWSILFSPYGLTNRVLSCFAIVVAATVLRLDSPAAAMAAQRKRAAGP